jgi:NAD(P)H-flavin reductase
VSWRPATILENKEIARASRWLLLRAADDEPVSYEPGNVLSLGLRLPQLRKQTHAYTVSFCDPDQRTFALLYRVIPDGRMTPSLATMRPGDSVEFEGQYHQPIRHEISAEPKLVIGISTGTGIGPLAGFARKSLEEGHITVPIRLFAGFREEADICLAAELDALAAQFSRFSWFPTLSKPGKSWKGMVGRVTTAVPPRLGPVKDLKDIHFHLVGNGAMLADFYEAFSRIGLPEQRLTSETYFNWEAEFTEETVLKMVASFG